MLTRYVLADLVRNPRRSLSTMVGVALGVGLFCGVLFFVDGLSASMTQRAVAPLAVDMQRIVTQPSGTSLTMTQTITPLGQRSAGERVTVNLQATNDGELATNEVVIRSQPAADLAFVPGSAELDATPIATVDDNPFSHGRGQTGFNLNTVKPGVTHRLTYLAEVRTAMVIDQSSVQSTYSSREHAVPVSANQPATVELQDLVDMVAEVDGVAAAGPLSIADLGSETLRAAGRVAAGPAKIFGFDNAYAVRDDTITIVDGRLTTNGAVISAEVAGELRLGLDDTITVSLPDGTTVDLQVTGIADLSRSRSLFSSRRGGDLETFIYLPKSVVVSPSTFANVIQPAFDRAASDRAGRLYSPYIREVDIGLDRELLDADPATALVQTRRIGEKVIALGSDTDYLLDNISNTLGVADADAGVAKRLFVFLGVPGAFLAAMLAAYAGTVLADAQRREQATLRIRGASRRHLLRMLAIRTALLAAAGAAIGLCSGYAVAATVLGRESLDRASTSSLVTSALLGSIGGFAATGLALYITGRRSIDREINEDRARLTLRAPLWRRARLDIIGAAIVVVGTVAAVRARAFDGAPGSVYFGRSVELNLVLLGLPIAVWITGSLLAARLVGMALVKTKPTSSAALGRPLPVLYRRSVGRRPWAISNGAIIVSLIVSLATSLAAFTASYDAAKVRDARYANGADIRITPRPTSRRTYTAEDVQLFRTDGVRSATPVIYGLSNVILRSARTSDPANLAAIDPATYPKVAPLESGGFDVGTSDAALQTLQDDATAILLSRDMAMFLKAEVGDTIRVLLARATDAQVEVKLHITDLYERLPGFPEGADAVMAISEHTQAVPSKTPDFFLSAAERDDDAGLQRAVDSLRAGPGNTGPLQIDTRATTLASDQSSLAALNIAGLVNLDSTFSLTMAVVTIAIFVFGLLLQRRREYITLRAQGLEPRTVRLLITLEAATVAIAGALAGLVVGLTMGFYFVTVLRPLFVLTPSYIVPLSGLATPVLLVLGATLASSVAASRLVNRLDPTELLRDE